MGIHHLLLAIDGTGSEDTSSDGWKDHLTGQNSHVQRFYNDFSGDKLMIEGPGTLGVEMTSKINEGLSWILNGLNFRLARKIPQDNISLNLIGHSRGGFGVLKIAQELQSISSQYLPPNSYKTGHNHMISSQQRAISNNKHFFDKLGLIKYPVKINFIGLYDPVDSTAGIDCQISTSNTRLVVNAIRSNPGKDSTDLLATELRSRPVMFNSLLVSPWSVKKFNTSHGGIGGDPGFFLNPYVNSIRNDLFCNAMQLILSDEELKIGRGFGAHLGNPHYLIDPRPALRQHIERKRILQIKKYWEESIAVDNYIRNAATSVNIPISGASNFVPWHSRDDKYGQRLRNLIMSSTP